MYPAEIFTLFPPFPRNNKIFVAMSFEDRFNKRWSDVLKPSIEGIEFSSGRLQAHRVDLTRASDSIITEIVREIAQCRLVLADLTTIGFLGDNPPKPVRNSNVLYEVGIAHASRRPEEVILLRSDDDSLDFDIAGVRVHSYDPGDIDNARNKVQSLIQDALKSVELHKSIAVQKGLQALDYLMYVYLHSLSDIKHPKMNTFQDLLVGSVQLNTIHRLLNFGMIEWAIKPLTPEHLDGPIPTEDAFEYRHTEFGRTVFFAARKNLNWPKAFEAYLKTPAGKDWLKKVVSENQQQPSAKDPPPV